MHFLQNKWTLALSSVGMVGLALVFVLLSDHSAAPAPIEVVPTIQKHPVSDLEGPTGGTYMEGGVPEYNPFNGNAYISTEAGGGPKSPYIVNKPAPDSHVYVFPEPYKSKRVSPDGGTLYTGTNSSAGTTGGTTNTSNNTSGEQVLPDLPPPPPPPPMPSQ